MFSEYVYIFTCLHTKNNGNKDYFMIYGVYSKAEDAKDDMEKHIKWISARDDIKSIVKGIGLQTSVGEMPKYYVIFKDGSKTEYGIQERILDLKCYK